jgi:hypothetical protein
MFYDPGCYGRVQLGALPSEVQRRLVALPGEWLEFDAAAGAIVVRHVQPSAGPSLPTIAGELVRMIETVGAALHAGIAGGDLFVHADANQALVRLRVERGGAVHIRFAHPDYARAVPQPYEPGRHDLVDPKVQRLNGEVTLRAGDAPRAAAALEAVADTYEGLYPEGAYAARAEGKAVRLTLQDVNLDAELLVAKLVELAAPGSLEGRLDVASFAGEAPERYGRFVFDRGVVRIQRPVLWDSEW